MNFHTFLMRLSVRKGLVATIHSNCACLTVPAPIHILSSGESYSERIRTLSGVCSTLLPMLISFWQCKQQTADNMVYYYNTGEQSIFKAGLKPIGLIALNWAPRWSYLLLSVQVQTTTHMHNLQETAMTLSIFHKIMMDIVH